MADYNESAYLESNPDVAAAVARGDFASGAAHYGAFGQYENRDAGGGTTGAQQNYWDSSGWAAQPGNAGGTRATGAQSTTSPNLAGNLPDNASFYSAPATFEGQNFNVGLNAQAWANVQRDIASGKSFNQAVLAQSGDGIGTANLMPSDSGYLPYGVDVVTGQTMLKMTQPSGSAYSSSGRSTGATSPSATQARPGVATGGAGYNTGGTSSGGSSFSSSGAPSLGFNLSNIAGPSQWDVSGNQTVANQLTALLASDNPLIQQARARAMQQSNARGLSNSSIAQTAGDAAAYDAMMKVAQQDASTNATAAQSNTAAQNQFTTDANAFLRNGYMADFNLSANEWAAQQDFARQQQLARLQAELNASSDATQTNNNLQQGYINALNESRKNWAIQYRELMADPNMSPENKTTAIKNLATSYNTQIKQYTGLLGWDYASWDIEYDTEAATPPTTPAGGGGNY